MSEFEYKVVAAPRRVRKIKGVKGADATLARSVEDIMAEHAADGWTYLRTDQFPVEEKPGPFSRRTTINRAVLVFQRKYISAAPAAVPIPAPAAQRPVTTQEPRDEPPITPFSAKREL